MRRGMAMVASRQVANSAWLVEEELRKLGVDC